jgi:hypothetical protein
MAAWRVPDESPRISDEKRALRLERYPRQSFDHRDAVLALLGRNDPDESRIHLLASDVSVEQLRPTYRVRATILAERAASDPDFARLAREVRALSDALDATDSQTTVFFLRLASPDGTVWIVFERADTGEVLGCVQSTDQRIVRPRANPWDP